MNACLKLITKIIDALGNLCSLLMLLMIANVFYDVIMRYFFNDVSIGMQELEWHLFAAMFMFGIAYTLKKMPMCELISFMMRCRRKNRPLLIFLAHWSLLCQSPY